MLHHDGDAEYTITAEPQVGFAIILALLLVNAVIGYIEEARAQSALDGTCAALSVVILYNTISELILNDSSVCCVLVYAGSSQAISGASLQCP